MGVEDLAEKTKMVLGDIRVKITSIDNDLKEAVKTGNDKLVDGLTTLLEKIHDPVVKLFRSFNEDVSWIPGRVKQTADAGGPPESTKDMGA